MSSIRHGRAAFACTVALLGGAALGPAAGQAVTWNVKGAGFGHGVGLSQYGAYGFAKHGAGYKHIVKHYYLGTTIGQGPAGKVRVLLAPYQSSIRFSGATAACGAELRRVKTYTATRSGNTVILRSPKGRSLGNCGKLMSATGTGPINLAGKGSYRGALQARPSSVSGRLNAINKVGIDDYVRGVVAGESPSSWPLAALRAQALVARSYGLTSGVGGRGFDLFDDTRSQVYGGVSAETPRTDRAVASTAGQVVLFKGHVARTYFFSTSGGFTENIENVFGGDPVPYLRGVADPYDGSSPLHRWRKVFSQRQMQEALGGYVRGKLRQIKVTERGVSPRIIKAKLIGSDGTTTVSGTTLYTSLGLYDRWAYFKKVQ